MALQDEKKVDVETEHAEHVVDAELGGIEKVEFVPSIEEAAASTAAWLISVTVSLGGFVSLSPFPGNLPFYGNFNSMP